MTIASVHLDLTQVLIVGIPAYIAALGGAIAAVIASLNRRSIRTPSGDSIGHVVERTHDLSAVSTAAVTGANGPLAKQARKRLNGELDAPPANS